MSELMNVTLYGIPNCDQVKKARVWLAAHQVDVQFHDFKKAGITAEIIRPWLSKWDWEALINRKGTTWRGLPESEKGAVMDSASAIECMIRYPSVIKRPVLVWNHGAQVNVLIGYSDDSYQRIIAQSGTR